jgi:hypothetical protein
MSMNIKVGSVVLFRRVDSSWLSKAIAMATKSSWTHAGIVYDLTDTEVITAEALAKGFTLVTRSREDFESDFLIREIEVLEPKKELFDLKEVIEGTLGRPYGYLDLLAILIYTITGKRIFKGTAKSLICSEAVSEVLYTCSRNKIDLSKEFNKPGSYITPDDIYCSKSLLRIKTK